MRRFLCVLLLVACDGPAPVDAGPPTIAYWPGTLDPLSDLGTIRGRTLARTTLHLHSPLSHDACDGAGWVDGALADPECLAHLRHALCVLHMDAAMLTDHAPFVNEVSIEAALWLQEGDEAIRDAAGNVIAGRLVCDDGHRVLVTVGSENTLMPVGLERHPDATDPVMLESVYDTDGADAVNVFRNAGALVWQAHTEGRALDVLRPLGIDGLEIYNLHANVGPDIRQEFLGLEPTDFVPALLAFAEPRYLLPPDLAVTSFLSENQPSLDRWDALLAEGQRIAGTGGCDAHENTFSILLTDGERGDSYRRMMLWVENHLLVDEVSPEGIDEALSHGRLYVTFEVFGTPIGFDFVAQDGASTYEMGDDAPIGSTLRLVRPRLPDGFPNDPPPTITMRIVRSTASGALEVASGDGETLEYVTTEAGPYRAEVRMIPENAREALAGGARFGELVREFPWVYGNPIFVGP